VGKMFHIAFTVDTYRTYSNGMTVQEIINEILQDKLIDAGAEEVVNQIINDLRTLITNEFVEQIVTDVTNQSILQILNSIQHATNERHGIVKGQDNNSPETWHRVSADEDGTLSVNRAVLEAKIDQKISQNGGGGGGTPLDRVLAKPDRSVIGTIENRELILQQTTPKQYGVVKCRKTCVCNRNPPSLESMDEMLVAVVKQDVHLFYPMVFPKKIPPRIAFFDKLTFIATDSTHCCCCHGNEHDQQ
jgi:hypothetical protein